MSVLKTRSGGNNVSSSISYYPLHIGVTPPPLDSRNLKYNATLVIWGGYVPQKTSKCSRVSPLRYHEEMCTFHSKSWNSADYSEGLGEPRILLVVIALSWDWTCCRSSMKLVGIVSNVSHNFMCLGIHIHSTSHGMEFYIIDWTLDTFCCKPLS